MRSIEECKKEVLARSEEKIRHRKKMRNRMVSGLIPLCICIVILAALPYSKSGAMEGQPANGQGADMKDFCVRRGKDQSCYRQKGALAWIDKRKSDMI